MRSFQFGRLAFNRLSQLAILACTAGAAVAVHASDPPDLSKLTESEKQQGFGQFQTSASEAPSPRPEDDPEAIRRRRAEEDRQRRQQNRLHRQRIAGVGAGSAAAGGMVLGNSFYNNYDASKSAWDPNSGNQDFASVDAFDETASTIVYDSSPSNVSGHSESRPMDFRTVRTHSISASVNSFFFRDLSRLNEPIVNGINSSQLGWSGAPGIEGQLAWQPSVDNDYGVHLGFAIAEGSDEATAAGVDRLFTTPAIGIAPSPFRSHRDMSFATVEANLLLAGMPYKSAIGIRWLHLQDELENQVLPAGLTHRINTNSDSLLAQFMIQPSIEWERVRFESLFQVGAGAFRGTSSTQIERIVGGPSDAPFDIQVGRTTGSLFFKGQLGLAIPVQKWFALRGGIQLLALTDTAQAAGQMKSTDFLEQKYHLRTESLVLGSLYAGIEMRR